MHFPRSLPAFLYSGLLALSLSVVSPLMAQEKAVLKGKVLGGEENDALPYANILIPESGKGTFSDRNGEFELRLTPDKNHVVHFSHTGHVTKKDSFRLEPGEEKSVNIILDIREMKGVEVRGDRVKARTMMRIPRKTVEEVPTASGDFVAQTLSAQPGVTINNELSSSYSVRGGNFDENLIYVNDVRIFRPFLAQTGRQEGLNFVNGDMVSSILFSAGGFEPSYGDRMSSVLDIRYKQPHELKGSVKGGLLGGSVHLEGASEGYRFTGVGGIRYRQNAYLLNSLETTGDYQPDFTDAQAFFTYDVTDRFELGLLAHYSRNRYNFQPGNRQTEFGTINLPLRLTVDFEGAERDLFETVTGALTGTYRPHPDLELKGIASSFSSDEVLAYDIEGRYRLDEVEIDPGSDEFGDAIQNRGIGGYHDHARNVLRSRIHSLSHKGSLEREERIWEWGLTYRYEHFRDRMKEWEMLDSAGYSLPHPRDSLGYQNPLLQPDHPLELNRSVRSDVTLFGHRGTGYLQHTWEKQLNDSAELDLTLGARGNYLSRNQEWLFSPRGNLTYNPGWFSPNDSSASDRIRFKLAGGYYYQPPLYREIRDLNGELHPDVRAQQSIHIVLGGDYAFKAWDRPFLLNTELYYKHLDRLNPYERDNVRIQYYANNRGKGYATGADLKLNGEFVPGLESWFSASFMKTEEKIQGDQYYRYFDDEGNEVFKGGNTEIEDSSRVEPGYIPRPMDQRLKVSAFFQDELPRWPSYKVHLKGIYGSGLPFGPPSFERRKDTLRMPPYRRVDIGFSKELLHKDSKMKDKPFFKHFESIRLRLDVFNLLNIRNTISYLWIRDVSGNRFAVPNNSTGRLINFTARFRF